MSSGEYSWRKCFNASSREQAEYVAGALSEALRNARLEAYGDSWHVFEAIRGGIGKFAKALLDSFIQAIVVKYLN